MDYPKISILIPTYNRAVFLKEALKSIVSQIENDIECIISDNASTDNTKAVIKDFQEQYNFIRYYRNETNLGPDRNILLCLKYARGEYVWWFGDDDRMQPGAIKSVLDVLNKHKDLSVLYVNYSIYSQNLEEIIKPRCVPANSDMLFNTPNHCLKTIGCHLSFMSSLVFQHKLYSLVQRVEDFVGSRLTPLYIILSVLAAGNNQSYLISYPYIEQRSGNSGGYDYFEFLIVELSRVLEAVKPLGYNKTSIRKINNDIIRLWLFKKIIYLRCEDPNSLKGVLPLLMKHFSTYPLFWITIFPSYVTPLFLIKFMRNIYRSSKRNNKVP